MKVGILSMQRVCNYGSLLQAYALKKTIENLGNECSFLDIKKGIDLDCHATAKNANPKRSKKLIADKLSTQGFKAFVSFFHRRLYNKIFKNRFFKILGLPKEMQPHGKFDLVVIGSDEVFNFAQKTSWGFSKQLFGEDINANKIISYAASFGWTTMKDVVDNQLEDELSDALKNMSAISVRDKNSETIIKSLSDKQVVLSLDPTLIYDFEKEMTNNFHIDNYMILYSYTGRTDSEEEIKAIQAFAKEHNKKIISLGFYHHWCDKNIIADPFKVLSYFKNADYIVTDTFHGTIFSIKFNKRFCTIIRDSNSEKLSFLLSQFNLLDRTASKAEEISDILKTPINYSEAEQLLDQEARNSLKYIKDSLSLENQPI